MDDVPAAADSGELIVLRVVLCAGGKTPASGESPVPVPSSFPATWKEGALEIFPTTRAGRWKVEGRWRVGGGGGGGRTPRSDITRLSAEL